MSRVHIKKQVEIERNPIEKFLLLVKDSIKKHRKKVISLFAGLIVILIISLGIFIYIESSLGYIDRYCLSIIARITIIPILPLKIL